MSTALMWPKIQAVVSECLLTISRLHGVKTLDVNFLQSKERLKDAQTSEEIQDIFQRVRPSGDSPIEPVLSRHLQGYERTLLSTNPRDGGQHRKPMHYFILVENLSSHDRRKLEKMLLDYLGPQNFPQNQIRICLFHMGWYNPFPREEFKLLRQNVAQLDIRNIMISLAPDSSSEVPESDDDLTSRIAAALAEIFAADYGGSLKVEDVTDQLLDATSSPLPSPRLPSASSKSRRSPVSLLDPREAELLSALESPLAKSVSPEQVEEWTVVLRRIVVGKTQATDEIYCTAIAVLDDVDRLKSVFTKEVLEKSGLRSIIRQLSTAEDIQEEATSRLWLSQKATELHQFWRTRFRDDERTSDAAASRSRNQ
ncbi:hypothetical protein HGRIS_010943 [Hohenbuehelia grisea]|uniref:Uncharacterized protein n=1 Tax=Hohenbuehelia grisea TaxID=104357 RepID=A0ABR3IYB2_9AGAR